MGAGQFRGVRGLGEDAGVGLQLGRVRGALGGEEVVEAGGAVGGGLVVNDPEEVFAGGVGFGPGAEDAVERGWKWGEWRVDRPRYETRAMR